MIMILIGFRHNQIELTANNVSQVDGNLGNLNLSIYRKGQMCKQEPCDEQRLMILCVAMIRFNLHIKSCVKDGDFNEQKRPRIFC